MRGFIVEHSCIQVTDKHNKPIGRINDIEILEIQITIISGHIITGAFRKIFLKKNNPKFHFYERKFLKLWLMELNYETLGQSHSCLYTM